MYTKWNWTNNIQKSSLGLVTKNRSKATILVFSQLLNAFLVLNKESPYVVTVTKRKRVILFISSLEFAVIAIRSLLPRKKSINSCLSRFRTKSLVWWIPDSSSHGLLNTRPCMSPRRAVLKFHSKLNYTTYCHNLDRRWVNQWLRVHRNTWESQICE